MKKTTLVLTYVWLGLAGLGALGIVGLAFALAFNGSGGDAYFGAITIIALAIVLALFWVMPLTIAGVLTLRRRVWGWRLLIGHTGLGVFGWFAASCVAVPEAIRAIRDRIEHGPYWGGYPEGPLMALAVLALLALSASTVVALLKDHPGEWAA